MARHSKNNCSSSYFTSHERERLSAYGTQRTRCGGDALRGPLTCHICLTATEGSTAAVEVMVCPEGHVGCRECFVESLLKQKRAAREAQARAAEERTAREQARVEQEQRVAVARFVGRPAPKTVDEKYILSESKGAAAGTACFGATPAHPVALKSLFKIRPSTECFACKKALHLSITACIPCGHLFCSDCVLDGQCAACQQPIDRTIRLQGEGTGFAAAGGAAATSRYEPAFY